MRLSPKLESYFWKEVHRICKSSRFLESAQYIQHGNSSVYQHSIAVAYYSCWVAEKLHLPVHWKSLIRGALLHDYFLYDWHADTSHGLHGFTHPQTALKNASHDFTLSSREQNLILRHMFPLTPIPPKHLEGWLVCMVDKICSLWETGKMPPKDYQKVFPFKK